jgi:carbonic anhydrase
MQRLVAGYKGFRDTRWESERQRYADLARDGQKPETLIIACSDSRSDPASIFNARPGELFVVRNIAAIVPPPEMDGAHHGTSSAIAFAVLMLKVRNILVMGHAQCGGVAAALDGSIGADVPFLRPWVDLLAPALERKTTDGVDRHVALERDGVVLSMQRLMEYPFVAERVKAGDLEINGARFGIADGKLEIYNAGKDQFVTV